MPKAMKHEKLVCYDGAPVGAKGIAKLLQSGAAPAAVIGLFYSAANEVSSRGLPYGLGMMAFNCLGLWVLNKVYDRLDRPTEFQEELIIIDKSGIRQNNIEAAKSLYERSTSINLRNVIMLLGTTTAAFTTGDSLLIAASFHLFGRTRWNLQRGIYPDGGPARSGLLRAMPKWSVQIKQP